MPRFRKKPIVIEAERRTEGGEVYDKLHDAFIPYEAGDWIITGVKGEQYPIKDQVFRETYEPVEDPFDPEKVSDTRAYDDD